MTKLYYLSTIVLTFFFISCSGTSSQFINEDYANGDQLGSVTVLTIQQSAFSKDFSNHTFGTLQGNETQLFEEFVTSFSTEVTEDAKGKLVLNNPVEFESREFETNLKSFKALAPSAGNILMDENIESRYVIILDQYRFRQYEVIEGSNTYAGHEQEIVPRISFSTKYVIWDNNIGDAVAWGMVDADRKIVISRLEEIYIELLTESFQKIVRRSPFSAQV